MNEHVRPENTAAYGAWRLSARLRTAVTFIRYNAKQVFASKFVYFLFASVVLYLAIVVIHSLETETPPSAGSVYYILIATGVLLIFYPSAYSLQSDVDSRMLETLFGIPDYRYKVWLARNAVQYITVLILLAGLAVFSRYALADFSVVVMLFHLMFPIIFLGSLAFMVSTITKSGNGTAAVMVVVGMFFWIAADPLDGSKWNLFHNPLLQLDETEMIAWAEITLYNRVYLVIGSLVTTMYGLLRLQKREKFM